ncbi:hypothetical protein HBI56_184800 [Parastagonospora nodorum]|uniref:Uncharacterized protein n=2 Tax=Phaeosphaeria nodorum (strain SN15 / ATCC MYA-4574 / FGSC 10173) TaxID=321614 RepID=A0A7U2FH90_PHANO|nr:hypothetical protein SNOG_14256 [Parastagonospora nodorum SN15]KAH3907327.1 hypothetical protein HBH56_193260 [Parastagonospora nodorum]EAT78493.1 hypothetical protein SNOG_14256 [Parastagonospora nodorum SN15]KAH3937945.1 hypothetical protein HBH54_008700 [Parastagonospora nodorum]KAH3938787.1 hypothetical protein HBH53_245680 [Parastagonospora nodorum]KAH3966509.1 hypothetical protein HBH52_197660 [Parastagonospora nodorum]
MARLQDQCMNDSNAGVYQLQFIIRRDVKLVQPPWVHHAEFVRAPPLLQS